MTEKKMLKRIICGVLAGAFLYTGTGLAAPAEEDIDSQIAEQQRILKELNDKKSENKSKEMQDKLTKLERQLTDLKNKPSYDAKGAIDAIAMQIVELRRQIESTNETQARIAELLDKIEKRQKEQPVVVEGKEYHGNAATRNFLVNPGGQGGDVSYTQDAINSQGNSTMIFSYAPNQLYKIYCRKGYLTDLAFKKGESIQFVGGGDTTGWMVSNSEVDGVPHLYIKPVVDTSTTNLIVTTDKHSYQIILNTSDWYNPMVQWSYEAEDRESSFFSKKKDERIVTGSTNSAHVEDLDFNFDVSGGGSNKPVMVFTDGEQTYIKFPKAMNKKYPLFVRERGRKQMALVSYRIKDNYFIVEKAFDMAQIRLSEKDIITIKHKS